MSSTHRTNTYSLDRYPAEGVVDAGGWYGGPHSRQSVLAPLLNPGTGARYIDRFMPYTAGHYTLTAVSVGSGTSAVTQLNDVAGGAIRITTAANADDGLQAQLNGGMFDLRTGGQINPYKIAAVARVRLSAVATTQLLFGVATTSTTLHASGVLTANKFIGLNMDAASQAVSGQEGVLQAKYKPTTAESVDSADTRGQLVDDTWHEIGFSIDQNGLFETWLDGVSTGSETQTVLPDSVLRFSFGAWNEAASSKTVDFKEVLVIS